MVPNMDFDLPEETRILQGVVRRFVDDELMPLELSLPERPNSLDLPPDIQKRLVSMIEELGLAALDAPIEIGGAGLYLLSELGSGVTGEIHHVDYC